MMISQRKVNIEKFLRVLPDGAPSPKSVPGFCAQAYQKNTKTVGPRKVARNPSSSGTYGRSAFSAYYGRVGFPVTSLPGDGDSSGQRFKWLVPFETVDYEKYFPVMARACANHYGRMARALPRCCGTCWPGTRQATTYCLPYRGW